jgi:uncharacterized protein (DUF169 family)
MTNAKIIDILTSVLQLKKKPVAIKAWKQAPADIPQYQGNAFPGMCTQIAEVQETGKTFHTNRDHCFCTGGVVATGVAPPTAPGDRDEIIRVHFEISKGYTDIPTAICYEEAMEKTIPCVKEKNAAVQLGLLSAIDAPDIVLLFCTPAAADILSRTYCYGAGEPIRGFSGNGGCPFLIQYPFVTGKPSFSVSDVAWRKYIGLAPEELTMSFPYQSLCRVCEDLPELAHAYRHYGEPPEA